MNFYGKKIRLSYLTVFYTSMISLGTLIHCPLHLLSHFFLSSQQVPTTFSCFPSGYHSLNLVRFLGKYNLALATPLKTVTPSLLAIATVPDGGLESYGPLLIYDEL